MTVRDTLEGVGATALLTAAARARETEKVDGLLSDPFARSLAGKEGFELLDRSAIGRSAEHDPPIYVVRHRFFDDVLTDLTASSDIRQIVLLAAGLDTRAFRLAWPSGTRLFEIDQPAVFAHKNAILEAQGATARCERLIVAADLREDWPAKLLSGGFDRDRPTAWVAEGLLFYLREAAVHRLLDDTGRLSPSGSHLLTDMISTSPGPPQKFKDFFASLGAPFLFATDDPADLVRRHGWDARAIPFDEVGHSLGIDFPAAGRVVIARR